MSTIHKVETPLNATKHAHPPQQKSKTKTHNDTVITFQLHNVAYYPTLWNTGWILLISIKEPDEVIYSTTNIVSSYEVPGENPNVIKTKFNCNVYPKVVVTDNKAMKVNETSRLDLITI